MRGPQKRALWIGLDRLKCSLEECEQAPKHAGSSLRRIPYVRKTPQILHATERSGFFPAPSKYASISSRVFPFVSGKNTAAVMK